MNNPQKNRVCGDCAHYMACSSWYVGSLKNADASCCRNYTPPISVDAVDVEPFRWIPVTERLPELFHPVIVCREHEGNRLLVEAGIKESSGWWRVYGTRTKAVRYWMPLPNPPPVNG